MKVRWYCSVLLSVYIID